jgi:D-glycero-alpha-D-manno-heptose-7-phosphate kinase
VQKWNWNYSREGRVFEREAIVGRRGYTDMSRRILVAFSGKRHNSGRINRRWLEECLHGRTRPGWIEANRIVNRLASHMSDGRWEEAAGSLRNEVAIRREITPEAFTPIIDRLIRESEEMGCGARFAGAGGGGSVWALGEVDAIERLRGVWEKVLKSTRKGRILDCAIDPDGVRAEEAQENERGIRNDSALGSQ